MPPRAHAEDEEAFSGTITAVLNGALIVDYDTYVPMASVASTSQEWREMEVGTHVSESRIWHEHGRNQRVASA